MNTLIGLIVIVGQIRGAVILFGGHKEAPRRLRIACGISLGLMLLAVIGLTQE